MNYEVFMSFIIKLINIRLILTIEPMLKKELFDPRPEETSEEICWHNISVSDKYHDLNFFIMSSMAWLKLNPDKNFADLETELRNRKLDTHLLASKPNLGPNTKLGLHNKSDVDREYEYECMFSCRPLNLAVEELLQHWSSYEDNFDHLSKAGIIMVDNADKLEKEPNIKIFNDTEKDINALIENNKKKLDITIISPEQIMNDLISECVKNFGKPPDKRLIGLTHNNCPIIGLFMEESIISDIGFSIEMSNGHSIPKIVRLDLTCSK